jgi:hypothetical protein
VRSNEFYENINKVNHKQTKLYSFLWYSFLCACIALRQFTMCIICLQLMFRKKSDPIRIRGSDPRQIGSNHRFYDPWSDPNQKNLIRFGSNQIRSTIHSNRIGSDLIRADSDRIRIGSDQNALLRSWKRCEMLIVKKRFATFLLKWLKTVAKRFFIR